MRLYRFFFSSSIDDSIGGFRMTPVRGADGRSHLALFSDFFSRAQGMVIHTNIDYFRLKNAILNTLDNVPVSEQVTLDIFESVESDEFDRETGIIGFKKYMTSNYYTCRKQYLCRLTLFNLFLLVGLALIFVDTLLCPDLPLWLSTCLETVAGVFIWQMVGYMAFEWRGDIKRLRRLLQMIDLKFDFRKWE